jgi:hypothetical protein
MPGKLTMSGTRVPSLKWVTWVKTPFSLRW